jgi:hypothetical protein
MVTIILNVFFISLLIWMFTPRYKHGEVRVLSNGVWSVTIIKSIKVPGWPDRDTVYVGKPKTNWYCDGQQADKIEVQRIESALTEADLLGTVIREVQEATVPS